MGKTATGEKLDRAHASLLEDLRKLEDSLHASAGLHPLKLRAQLAVTHTQITDHFGFEEQNGWKDAVLKQEPRLEHAARGLVDEHRQLVRSLDTLIEEVEDAQNLDDVFREKVLRWIQRVRDHEARENDLLEDAFVEDLGAGD